MCDDVPILIYSHSKQLPTYLRDPLKKKDWHSYWRKCYFWCWIHHHHQKKKKRSILKDMSIFISIGKYTIRASLTKNREHVCNNKIIKLKDYACLNALVEGRFVLGSAIRNIPCETWLDQDLETGRLLQIINRDP